MSNIRDNTSCGRSGGSNLGRWLNVDDEEQVVSMNGVQRWRQLSGRNMVCEFCGRSNVGPFTRGALKGWPRRN